MSDELAAETPDAAIRAYLFAIGFTLVLVGGDMMAEKVDPRFYTGLALVIIALPVHLSWVFWKKLKPLLSTYVLVQAGLIAGSLRWWLGILLLLLAAAILSPYVEQQRWPFASQLASLRGPPVNEIAEAVVSKLPKSVSADEIAVAVSQKLLPNVTSSSEEIDKVTNHLREQVAQKNSELQSISQQLASATQQIDAMSKQNSDLAKQLQRMQNPDRLGFADQPFLTRKLTHNEAENLIGLIDDLSEIFHEEESTQNLVPGDGRMAPPPTLERAYPVKTHTHYI